MTRPVEVWHAISPASVGGTPQSCTPTITEEALINATASPPTSRPRSRMASFVIEELMISPGATSICTMPLTALCSMGTTVPLN